MAGLQITEVHKSFGSVDVIHDVSLEIDEGEFCVFVGPSGCGKSTLLRMVAGLEEATAGTIAIGGEVVNDVDPSERGVAMVFQSYALYPHMTVAENMGFGLRMTGGDPALIRQRVETAAKILHLEPLLGRKPKQLSGGQRQRVAIGRAIVREPKVFLFDEPLSNLDAALRASTRAEIAALHRRLGATMIYVTHDQVEAMTLGTRICIMNGGRVMQLGRPLEVYHRPVNTFVAGFLGNPPMNLLPAVVPDGGRGVGLGGSVLQLPEDRMPPVASGHELTFGIRPEDVALRPQEGGSVAEVKGRVAQMEALGAETVVLVTLQDGAALTARLSGDAGLRIGETCSLFLDLKAAQVFGSEGNAMIPAQRPEEKREGT